MVAPETNWKIEPMNIANRLSVLRILFVPLFISSLMYYSADENLFHYVALSVFLIACLTDGLDGFIARRLGQKTVLGSYLDPIADKMLLLAGFLSLSFMTHLPDEMKIPVWVTIPVITRDAIILLGATMIFLTTGKLKAEPLFIGKLTTVSQMATLVAALMLAPGDLRFYLHLISVFLTVVSGLKYIQIGGRLVQPS